MEVRKPNTSQLLGYFWNLIPFSIGHIDTSSLTYFKSIWMLLDPRLSLWAHWTLGQVLPTLKMLPVQSVGFMRCDEFQMFVWHLVFHSQNQNQETKRSGRHWHIKLTAIFLALIFFFFYSLMICTTFFLMLKKCSA